jgi:hypothetical protein
MRHEFGLTMAQVARMGRDEALLSGKADVGTVTDNAVRNLIDDLIVPYLVEEFLRLYGPAAVAKMNDKNIKSQPDSELDSTP